MAIARHRGFVILLLAVLVARLLSLGLVQLDHPERVITVDGHTYLHGAEALLVTGAFAQSPQAPLTPQTVRTPGYTVFLALGKLMFADSLALTMALQALASLVPLVTAYALAARFWGRRAGMAAAWFLALDPTSLIYAHLVQTETIYAALLALALWAGVRLTEADPPAPRLVLPGPGSGPGPGHPGASHLLLPDLAGPALAGLARAGQGPAPRGRRQTGFAPAPALGPAHRRLAGAQPTGLGQQPVLPHPGHQLPLLPGGGGDRGPGWPQPGAGPRPAQGRG